MWGHVDQIVKYPTSDQVTEITPVHVLQNKLVLEVCLNYQYSLYTNHFIQRFVQLLAPLWVSHIFHLYVSHPRFSQGKVCINLSRDTVFEFWSIAALLDQ